MVRFKINIKVSNLLIMNCLIIMKECYLQRYFPQECNPCILHISQLGYIRFFFDILGQELMIFNALFL